MHLICAAKTCVHWSAWFRLKTRTFWMPLVLHVKAIYKAIKFLIQSTHTQEIIISIMKITQLIKLL